jgi:Zn-finger nucleic acid-binding protein
MNRTNFGTHSGVIVDVCMRHGIWFDAGELPKVLEFVESGGLQRARRRQLEEVASTKRSAHSSRVRSEVEAAMAGEGDLDGNIPGVLDGRDASVSHASPPAWSTGLWDDAREAASEMLEGLRKLLRRN